MCVFNKSHICRNDSSSIPFIPVQIGVEKAVVRQGSPDMTIFLEKQVKQGSQCEIEIKYTKNLPNTTTDAIFHSSYVDSRTKDSQWFISTYLRPNLARNLFPCFDEPAFKAPFTIHVARQKEMTTISNMPLDRTEEM